MIEKESIDDLKNRLDIVDVLSSYIEVKKSGANFKALCPFHGESTPSFVISPAKGIYHCFGCGVGGDSIKFVMEYEHLSYPETLEKLASEYNVTLTYSQQTKKLDTRLLESLNKFFKTYLQKQPDALAYLKDRFISNSSIEKFEIGYAPSNDEVLAFLKQNLFSIDEALELGAVALNESGRAYSRFISRITFPIHSLNGAVVGFGGRTITNHPAKYINSSQSKVFNKSRLLYGYTKAKMDIFKKSKIIITEGYLDVIMLHQAGFTHCVATLGTALTKEHIPLIKKADPEVIVAYDGDKAGLNAALKASYMLASSSTKGGVVVFEGGRDPADMVKENKLDELKSMFMAPIPYAKFVLVQISKSHNLQDPLQKEEALKEAKVFLSTLSDVLRSEYSSFFASLIAVDLNFLNTSKNRAKVFNTSLGVKEDTSELNILKTVIEDEGLLDIVLQSMDISLFKMHRQEFIDFIENRYNPKLNEVQIRDDITVLNSDELKKQICYILVTNYQLSLKQVSRENISLEEKSFKIREIKEKIIKLKKGELV